MEVTSMKRIVSFLLALSLFAALVACGSADPETTPEPTPTSTIEPTATPDPTPEPTPDPTPEPSPEPSLKDAAYSDPVYSIYDISTLDVDLFDLAESVAPPDIAESIADLRGISGAYESDNVYDFYVRIGNCRFHFLSGVAFSDNAEAIRVIQAAIPNDETAPYFLAAILHLHSGIDLQDALEIAMDYINGGHFADDISVYKDTEWPQPYAVILADFGEYYYALLEFTTAFKESDFYSDRIDANALFTAYCAFGFPDDE